MSMMDNIRYVFQIPLSWFRMVHAFCFGSYGGHLIRITRDKDGSASFDVDEEELKQYLGFVNSSGSVQSFDGKTVGQSSQKTDSWSMGGGLDLEVYVVSRIDKPQGGVAKLFLRKMRIAASGHVVSIGAENYGLEVI